MFFQVPAIGQSAARSTVCEPWHSDTRLRPPKKGILGGLGWYAGTPDSSKEHSMHKKMIFILVIGLGLSQGCATGNDYEKLYKDLTEARRTQRQDAAAHDASTEEMQAALDELRKDKERSQALADQYKGLVASFKDLIDSGA